MSCRTNVSGTTSASTLVVVSRSAPTESMSAPHPSPRRGIGRIDVRIPCRRLAEGSGAQVRDVLLALRDGGTQRRRARGRQRRALAPGRLVDETPGALEE